MWDATSIDSFQHINMLTRVLKEEIKAADDSHTAALLLKFGYNPL